jgi:hypothetical protein
LQYLKLPGTSAALGGTNYYKSFSIENRIAWRAR